MWKPIIKKRGRPKMLQRIKQATVCINDDLHEQLTDYAYGHGYTIKDCATEAIEQYLTKRIKRKQK